MATKKRGRRTPAKKSRAPEAPPKFVQIAVSVHPSGNQEENVYALDERGTVWWYDFDDSNWNPLGNDRYTFLAGGR